jgi:hypothetical protein
VIVCSFVHILSNSNLFYSFFGWRGDTIWKTALCLSHR